MGRVRIPIPVKYFSAILFCQESNLIEIYQRLENQFGQIDLMSPVFDFSYTDYYFSEMGESLRKQFVSFEKLQSPDKLDSFKIQTNKIEKMFYLGGKRCVNLDPGYVEKAKMVLASTKNYSHRIYLRNGIYADLQYRFRAGAYTFLEWTYPDYKDIIAMNFFRDIRRIYNKQLEKGISNQ